jgi:hypothetical protein
VEVWNVLQPRPGEEDSFMQHCLSDVGRLCPWPWSVKSRPLLHGQPNGSCDPAARPASRSCRAQRRHQAMILPQARFDTVNCGGESRLARRTR